MFLTTCVVTSPQQPAQLLDLRQRPYVIFNLDMTSNFTKVLKYKHKVLANISEKWY